MFVRSLILTFQAHGQHVAISQSEQVLQSEVTSVHGRLGSLDTSQADGGEDSSNRELHGEFVCQDANGCHHVLTLSGEGFIQQ